MGSAQHSLTLAESVAETLRGLPHLGGWLALAGSTLGVVALDWFLSREQSRRTSWVALVGLWTAIALLLPSWRTVLAGGPIVAGWGMLVLDPLALVLSLVFIVTTVVVVGMSRSASELSGRRMGEYYALLLTATLSACLVVAATNLLLLYLAFETLSLCSYVLAGYCKDRRRNVEAALKYVLFGAVASAVMLYGLSLLYGMVGTLDLRGIAVLGAVQSPSAVVLVMVLVLAGMAFKMSLVPFHFWAPDVYQGAPTPVTAYLSVVSKAAGFGVFMRFFAPLLGVVLPGISGQVGRDATTEFAFLSMLWLVAVATMTLGNVVALRQTEFKRLLAYSSIAHAGYMVSALVAASSTAYASVIFYVVVYAIANLGLFFAAQIVEASKDNAEIVSLRGAVYESPTFAVAVAILLWSLIGLPPSAGFMGKFFLFYALVERAMHSPVAVFYYALVLLALFNSVVSLSYYIGVIREMTFYAPQAHKPALRPSGFAKAALVGAAGLVLAIQLDWRPVTNFANKAVSATPSRQGVQTVSHFGTNLASSQGSSSLAP